VARPAHDDQAGQSVDYGGRVTAVPEVQYWWREAPVPGWSGDHPGVRIDGYLLCPLTCRVLVQDDDGVFNLIGVRAGSLRM